MYEEDIDFVLTRYKDLFGFDLSYMRFKVDPQPVHIDGSPCHELDPDECGGDCTRLGWIRLNPDMRSVMRRYGVDGDVKEFTRVIIAHELAHELWNSVVGENFKQDVLSKAESENFSTPYLETVSPSKLREETFCEWMANAVMRGGVKSGFYKLEFRQVLDGGGELKSILRGMPSYADNPRLNMFQFEKYLTDDSAFATLWYGCFDGSRCMSLAVLKRYHDDGVILLAEVQSAVKGYGQPLIENILSRSRNIWWCADPDGGESLVEYYRRFGVNEYLIRKSKWVGNRPEYAFYKTEDPEHERIILNTLRRADACDSLYKPVRLRFS